MALVVTIPVVAVVAVANRLKSRGPVFFRQIRVGRDGQQFEIIKLRTMVVDAEARKAELMDQNESDGALFKIRNDPRVTPIGRVPAQALARRAARSSGTCCAAR